MLLHLMHTSPAIRTRTLKALQGRVIVQWTLHEGHTAPLKLFAWLGVCASVVKTLDVRVRWPEREEEEDEDDFGRYIADDVKTLEADLSGVCYECNARALLTV